MAVPKHNFGRRRRVTKQLPSKWITRLDGSRRIVCRAKLECGHVVERGHPVQHTARCYSCG